MQTRREHRREAGRFEHGLTLIEACIVVAVTAIVAATAAPSFAGFIETRRLESAASRLAADIQFVRSEVIARNQALRLSLHASAASSCWIVHSGAVAQCTCTPAGEAVCTGGAVAIKSVALPAGERITVSANVASIVFDPLHGTSSPTGTISLTDRRGRSIRQIVNILGRVRSCVAGGAVAGYRDC